MPLNPKLFNPDTVNALRQLNEPGRDTLREIAKAYLKDAPRSVKDLENLLYARNYSALAALSHRLKSASGSLGAEALAKDFALLEEAAIARDAENLLRVIPRLEVNFGEVVKALENLVGSEAA